jgi:all-trans-retinol 13,14-reductase
MILTLVFLTFLASSCLYYFFTTKFDNPRYYKLNTLRAKSLDIPDDKLVTTRYSKLKVNKDIDTIIIGSGIGGLTSASLLAQTGRRVLVLEQHYIAGGCTHTFVDKKVEHESGIHYVGSIHKYKPLFEIVGDDEIEWCQLGHEDPENLVYDEIIVDGESYRLPAGKQNLIDYLIKRFPDDKYGIREYFTLVEMAAKKNLFFKLKTAPYFFSVIYDYFSRFLGNTYYKFNEVSAEYIVHRYIKNETLRKVLLGQFPDYGLLPSEASFFIHASIVNHYLEGGYYPKGGPSVIAKSIVKKINKFGGQVFVGEKVRNIIIEDGVAKGVLMNNGDIIPAKNVVSATGIKTTFESLVSKNSVPKMYKRILEKIPPSCQHFYLFVNLDGTPSELNLPSNNFWIYPTDSETGKSEFNKLITGMKNDPLDTDSKVPAFLGFSCRKDSTWESRFPNKSNCVIITQVDYDYFKQWEDWRDIDYRRIKNEISLKILDTILYEYFPQTKGKVTHYDGATPLTTKFYINSQCGESYGLEMNKYRAVNCYDIRPKTPIKNLYLTGQDICTLGFTGAFMSGVLTASVMEEFDTIGDIYYNRNIVSELIQAYKNVEV